MSSLPYYHEIYRAPHAEIGLTLLLRHDKI